MALASRPKRSMSSVALIVLVSVVLSVGMMNFFAVKLLDNRLGLPGPMGGSLQSMSAVERGAPGFTSNISSLVGVTLDEAGVSTLYRPENRAVLTQGMTMEELELCRTAAGGPRGGQYKCENDTTCMSCQPEWSLSLGKTIINEYHDESKMKRRRLELTQLLTSAELDDPNGAVWILVTDENYMHMALNWACSAEANGISYRKRTIFGATSPAAFQLLQKLGLAAFDLTKWYSTAPSDVDMRKNKLEGIRGAKVMNIAMMLDVIALGRSALFIDADVVFFRNPEPFLGLYLPNANFDMQTCPALRWDAGGQANTGFIYFRPTHNSRVLLESMLAIAPVLLWVDDQSAWNTVLRNYKLRQVTWHNIPRGLCLDLHTEKQFTESRETLLVAHFVAGKKMERMRKMGLYFLNASCTHYPIMSGAGLLR